MRLLLFIALAATSAHAQDMASMRWGELSDAERALDGYAPDPDASALVLGDHGAARIVVLPRTARMEVTRHRRVKVFNEAGYRLGEVAIRHGDDDSIVKVRGQTFVPRPDGTYERVELDRGTIRRETVRDGVEEVRFSMPALAPGAVFEYSYVHETQDLYSPPTWSFQSAEPTLYSAYSFTAPEFFDYLSVAQGPGVRAEAEDSRYTGDWTETIASWTARDVPALRDEPFTTTEEDYRHEVEHQLRTVAIPGRTHETVLGTWGAVAEELDGHREFGRRVRARGAVAELAATARGTDEQKARALYEALRRGYVWNGERGVFAERDLREVVETKGGSAAELNLLLLALLREAGVSASPVLISTRSHGRVLRQYPLTSRFDHVLVLARPEGGELQLLDATDPHRPYGLLPVQALSGEGWLADPDAHAWIEFSPPATTATTVALQGALAADGRLTGELSLRLDGYDALRARGALAEDAAAPDAAAAAADADAALEITIAEVSGLDDPAAPLAVRAQVSAQAGEALGGEIYLSPFVAMRMEENPFQRARRAHPVDFAYPSKRVYLATVALPEGYALEAVPEPLQLTIPSRAVGYSRLIAEAGGQLQIRTALTIATSSVQPEEYPALRDLYSRIVAAEGEALVLVPTAPAAE